MMTLSKKSSYLTSFATMFGRYRYIRVPMGASLSSNCFQYKMDQIFGPIEQYCGITDDLIIYGYTLEDHDRVLFTVIDTAKQVGLKFNPDKCIFRCMHNSIHWNVNRCQQYKARSKEIKALNELPLPSNVCEIQSFLEIVKYLSHFSSKIVSLTGSLRQLVKKCNVFKTEKHHEIAFKAIVNELSSDKLLKIL